VAPLNCAVFGLVVGPETPDHEKLRALFVAGKADRRARWALLGESIVLYAPRSLHPLRPRAVLTTESPYGSMDESLWHRNLDDFLEENGIPTRRVPPGMSGRGIPPTERFTFGPLILIGAEQAGLVSEDPKRTPTP